MAGPVVRMLCGQMICVRPSHHLPVYGDPEALRAAAAWRVAAGKRTQGPAPIPAWEVLPRPALPAEVTGGALALAQLGSERGWAVSSRFGRGPYRSGSTERAAVKVCSMVRVNLAARGVSLNGAPAVHVHAVGCWADGRTTGAFWWRDGSLPQSIGIEALELLIKQSTVVRR